MVEGAELAGDQWITQSLKQELRTAAAAVSHRYCSDGVYACPLNEDAILRRGQEPRCDCGYDERKSLLTRAAAAIAALLQAQGIEDFKRK